MGKCMDVKAYIWDLDGTLLDSYGVIVSGILETWRSYGLRAEREEVNEQVIRHSVTFYLKTVADSSGLPFDEMKDRFDRIVDQRKGEIGAIPHAKEALEALRHKGARHFVYTHRGETTAAILRQIGLYDCFDEIVTAENGFPRKPEPDAVLYLMQKYDLDPHAVYYVGDRTLDMDCAQNAGIQGILYLPAGSYCIPNGSETRIVHDLLEIGEV